MAPRYHRPSSAAVHCRGTWLAERTRAALARKEAQDRRLVTAALCGIADRGKRPRALVGALRWQASEPRSDTEHVSNRVGQLRTIESVKVEFINPICLQHTYLFGCDDAGYGAALLAPHIAENLTAWA
jgi:hypothetical protein